MTHSGLLPSEKSSPSAFALPLMNGRGYPMTTTIHFSGLNTDPLFLIHLASDSRYRVYPQVSLLPCRPDFRQMGLASLNTHPLGNTNQFHPFTEIPKAPSLARHKEHFVRLLRSFLPYFRISSLVKNSKYDYVWLVFYKIDRVRESLA